MYMTPECKITTDNCLLSLIRGIKRKVKIGKRLLVGESVVI